MIYFQIFFIVLGVFLIILSVLNYFFHFKSSIFISKRIIEYLDESERIKYQKATAIPAAVLGIMVVIYWIFFIYNDIISIIWCGPYFVYIVWTMILNKIYLGYFFVWSIPKKIF